jgi:O-antigen ligase
MTTFSRAARWVRVIEIIILWLYTYRSNILFYIKKIIIPLLIIVGIISIIGYSQIIGRDFSNTGHFLLLQKWLTYITQHRVMWLGAWSVWPASYQYGWSEFNPENQFIQIFIEFGIIGFVWRMLLYLWFTWFGLQYRNTLQDKKKKDTDISIHIVVAMSIGMIGLAIAGLVLHSFVDRMIVLPMMICTWLAIWLSLYHQESLPKIT